MHSLDKFTRRCTLTSAFLSTMAAWAAVAVITESPAVLAAETGSGPNVVLILADDLGYGDLGCFGNAKNKTPHLDALAAGGVRFTDFHSSGAICCPTRAGLLTGRYQQRVGMHGNLGEVSDRGLPPDQITFAELVRTAGYRTGLVGKWHLGNQPKFMPTQQGFEYFRGMGWGKLDYISHITPRGAADWWENDRLQPEEGYSTHLITRHAVEFIERNRDRSFCLYVAFNAPHAPYQRPEDKPIYELGVSAVEKNGTQTADVYAAMIHEMDEGVGRIVATLKQAGLERKTLVFFLSDNGPVAPGSTGGLRGSKGSVYEGGHRVPAIAYWPGTIASGKVWDAPAVSLDLYPTIAQLARVPLPPGRAIDGVSLASLLLEGKAPADRMLFWAHQNGRVARQGDWKYVAFRQAAKESALYNLASDRAEKTDMSAQQPERARLLREALAKWEHEIAEGNPEAFGPMQQASKQP